MNTHDNEKLYGLGEQYTDVDLKGNEIQFLVQDKVAGNYPGLHAVTEFFLKSYLTYWPSPVYVSSENYYLALNTTEYSHFDFKHFADKVEIEVFATNIGVYISNPQISIPATVKVFHSS